jgi:hypothetical protein
LQRYWADWGCVILQPYDMEVGAGTFHPATTLRALGPKPWNAAYVQPSRRPKDGRYGENPNRLQHYYQFQVILKPSPDDLQELYLKSLYRDRHRSEAARHPLRRGRLGKPDARRLGARLGMLVRRHGGLAVHLFPAGRRLRMRAGRGELTYGLERLAMYVQGVDRLRSQLQRPRRRRARQLRRRVPAGRAGIFAAQFRICRHRHAEKTGRLFIVSPDSIPRDERLVRAHMALSTLRAAYPGARFMTVLREPTCRLLSHWVFWRGFTDETGQGLGGVGGVFGAGARAA